MSSIGSLFLGERSLAVASVKGGNDPVEWLSLESAESSLKRPRVATKSRPSVAIPDPLSATTKRLLSELELDRLKAVSGDLLASGGEKPTPCPHVGMCAKMPTQLG